MVAQIVCQTLEDYELFYFCNQIVMFFVLFLFKKNPKKCNCFLLLSVTNYITNKNTNLHLLTDVLADSYECGVIDKKCWQELLTRTYITLEGQQHA
jgi:hypothetical protein